jgi:hypothetical protein
VQSIWTILPTVQGYVVVRISIGVCHRLKSLGLMGQKYILLSTVAPPFPRPTSTRYLLAALLITNTLSVTTHSLCRTTQVENSSHSSQLHHSAARRELPILPHIWRVLGLSLRCCQGGSPWALKDVARPLGFIEAGVKVATHFTSSTNAVSVCFT